MAVGAPAVLSDDNAFLKNFINHEMLNILGVIVAITLASAAQLHLTLNGIEERLGIPNCFLKTRAGVQSSVYWLIGLFLIALLLMVIKPLVALSHWSQTIANGAAIIIVVWNALILVSLTQAVFAVSAVTDEDD
jgi:hypothetical protein